MNQALEAQPVAVATLSVTPYAGKETSCSYAVWLSDGMWSITTPGEYPLYAAPAADGNARDAARWRYFRSVGLNGKKNEELDAAFDAAMSKEQP